MARDYVALVEHQLGGGPCHLIGWSFGGVIALEMARLRAAAGQSVASLTLLDSYAAASRREPPPDPRDVILWFARDLGLDLARDDLAGLDRDQALAHVATRATAAALLPGHVAVPQLTRALRVFEANLAAGLEHHAQPFHGNATLIAAADGEPCVDPSHGFRALVTGHVDLLSAPGNHDSLLRPPHVATVARMLDELLAKHEAGRADEKTDTRRESASAATGGQNHR
jgi:thioesterase domain-containing protein